MGAEDVLKVHKTLPETQLMATHMEAVNHAYLTRKELKNFAIKHNFYGVKNENDLKCFRFYIDETAEEFEIDVRSNNEKCGGDPNVEPRLFSYIVNKKTGKLLTDSFEYAEKKGIDWDGSYLPID